MHQSEDWVFAHGSQILMAFLVLTPMLIALWFVRQHSVTHKHLHARTLLITAIRCAVASGFHVLSGCPENDGRAIGDAEKSQRCQGDKKTLPP